VGDPREDGAPDPGRRPTASTVRAAGALLFAAGATTILGIITAEALFPGSYSTGANEISDLGGRAGQDGPVSSATIFNGALVTAGLLTLGAALALWRASADRVLAGLLAVLAAGLVAVGETAVPLPGVRHRCGIAHRARRLPGGPQRRAAAGSGRRRVGALGRLSAPAVVRRLRRLPHGSRPHDRPTVESRAAEPTVVTPARHDGPTELTREVPWAGRLLLLRRSRAAALTPPAVPG
jgi:hypothetical protein